MAENPVIVLVHGARHGSWCREPLVPHLGELDVRLVDLPSAGENPAGPAGLRADADALRSVVATVPGPVIVCAHSYAGAVASQALSGLGNLAHIVYLCSFLIGRASRCRGPWAGLPHHGGRCGRTATWTRWARSGSSTRTVPRGRWPRRWPGCGRTRSPRSASSSPRPHGNRCPPPRDQAIPPEAQRQMATSASPVRELDTSHSPFLSQPQLLAALLREAGAGRRGGGVGGRRDAFGASSAPKASLRASVTRRSRPSRPSRPARPAG
jgi:hypothetical protein